MAERSSNSSRGLFTGVGVVAAAAVIFFGVRAFSHEKVQVRTARATHADLISTVSANGKVEPVEDFQAHAPGPGVVAKVFVQVGQHVERGAHLIKMDDSDALSKIASARAAEQAASTGLNNMQSGGTQDERLAENADLENALSQQKQAAATLTTTQLLQQKGSASASEVSAAQQRLTDAQARVSQLQARRQSRYSTGDLAAQRSQVAQARAAVQAARSGYAGVDIRAPFAGTVYSVPVSDYDFVQFGEALLNLADLNRIQVRAYFDEPEIGNLAAGQPVKIVWDARPNSVWHGHIQRAPTTVITYGTRNVGESIISVDDARGDLLPNTNVTVTVTTSQVFNVLSLPREALHTDGPHDFVYRVVDGKLVTTPVQVGALNLTRVQITSGLTDGDIVALTSTTNSDLKNGLEVKALP